MLMDLSYYFFLSVFARAFLKITYKERCKLHLQGQAGWAGRNWVGMEPNALCKAAGPLPKPLQMDMLIYRRKSQELQ